MNERSPYLASTLGHVLVVVALLWLTSLQRPALFVPGVRIVALPSGGGPGKGAVGAKPPPVAVTPPAAKVEEAPPPAPRQPKEKRPPEKKAPPRRQPERAATEGARPAVETGMVSKSKGVTQEAARPRPGAAAVGTSSPGSGGPGSGPGLGGVGIEAEGESGVGAWYLALLRDRIASAWLPPPAIGRSGEASASVHFYLRRAGGAPEKAEVRESSQVSYFDRAALRAILDAAPLPPLPQEFGSDPTGFTLLFKQQY